MVKRKWTRLVVIMVAAVMFGSFSSQAEAYGIHAELKNVDLTEEQKEQLSTLHKNIIEQKKELVDKYVEFGMIPENKREKIKQHLDDRYNRLVENNFQPLRERRFH
ncbi:YckD family protein [Alteribacillus sp. JSM 102045]|uniref:YckD family protein n=1 Tax=Alteribacillus sp. JSM 102045 TaxID=1562101 RepID=UPI0035C1790F